MRETSRRTHRDARVSMQRLLRNALPLLRWEGLLRVSAVMIWVRTYKRFRLLTHA